MGHYNGLVAPNFRSLTHKDMHELTISFTSFHVFLIITDSAQHLRSIMSKERSALIALMMVLTIMTGAAFLVALKVTFL
jgi:hypothetical protein